MLEVMEIRGVKRQNMTAVPMGVDLARIRVAAIAPAVDHRLAGCRPLIYLGALDRGRRIDFLFHVLARIRAAIPKAVLILAGSASEDMDWLRHEAQRIGVSSAVVWLGWQPTEQAWRYVKCAELGFSPIPPGPLYDVSSPTKALEYMALGVPVVANRIPDQEKVLRESHAGLVVDYDVAAFADAALALLRDPVRARAMGSRGPDYIARERDYAVISERVASVYRTLLAPAAGAAGVPEVDTR
jgi:glycosyltransferase involved in cell wall biosynthesis